MHKTFGPDSKYIVVKTVIKLTEVVFNMVVKGEILYKHLCWHIPLPKTLSTKTIITEIWKFTD